MTIQKPHKEWLSGRGLDVELAERFGLTTVVRDGAAWLAVPYCIDGEIVNHKYRRTSQKDHRMDQGAPLVLWNSDCLRDPSVKSGHQAIVVTEGEWDAITAVQVGFPFTVSVPNGAPSSETADLDNAKRYEWIDRHLDDLKCVQHFILATDDDEAGRYLRADLVALFGAERCSFIEYPFPCKDLNEVLNEYGADRVAQCISTAKHYPVQGLYGIDDFPEKGEVRSYDCGIDPIDDLIKIVPGTLTVLTGYANSGKSSLMNCVLAHVMKNHFAVCVASFETDVKPILRDGLRKALLQCGGHNMLNNANLKHADECIRDRLAIISQNVEEDMEMDLEKFLDLCRTAVLRRGVKMILLDPWNELEHKKRRDETEHDYTGRALRAIKRFAKHHDVAFWIVAHPTKPQPGVNKIPGLYDVSGSAHWANKADYGLTYHRPKFDENKAQIVVNKVRMGLPGDKGDVEVMFDFRDSTFRPFA